MAAARGRLGVQLGLGDDVGVGAQPVFQGLAHLGDQVLQHAHLAGQGLGAQLGVDGHRLGQFAQALVQIFQLVGQDYMGLAHIADLPAQGGGVEQPFQIAVQSQGQAQPADQGGHARTPAAATAPNFQRRSHG